MFKSEPYSLRDISLLLEELIGAHCEPLYFEDTSRTNELASRAAAPFGASLIAVDNGDGEGGIVSAEFQPKTEDHISEFATRFEKPFRELFLWAVLLNRFELARFIWQKGEEAITDALVACRLFQVMHDKIGDGHYEMRKALKQHAM